MTIVKTEIGKQDQAARVSVAAHGTLAETDVQRALESLRTDVDALGGAIVTTDNAVARFNGTDGTLQDSGIQLSDTNALSPATNDAGALGTTALGWSDLHLAATATINVANGDWVGTHSAGIFTVSTGDWRVTTAGTNTASVVTVGGTQTLTAKTLTSPVITTSPTAAGATWTDLGTVTTADINGGTVDGAVIGGASAAAITGTLITGQRFVPNNSTVPTDGMYLPAANTLGWAVNSAAELQLTATALSPAADGGQSLGTTALGWQNLFGNTGFVWNIENGDWVATHTSGILTVGTGDLRVTTAGTNTASVVTVGGTQTLTGKTLTSAVVDVGLEVGNASDTTLTRAAAGILAVEGTQLLKAGKQTVWLPASALLSATTSGPASAQFESATNDINFRVLDFDATADEHAHFNIAFPKSWDESTVTFQVWWTTSATDTDGVAWGLQAIALSDNDTGDTAFGTPVVVTDDAQGAANEILVTAESSAVTIGGTPAEGDVVFFRIFRDVSDANDDMTEDARLIGLKLFFTTNAATDV